MPATSDFPLPHGHSAAVLFRFPATSRLRTLGGAFRFASPRPSSPSLVSPNRIRGDVPVTDTLIQYLEDAALIAATWGPFLIFFFMAVESSFIPFPSEVVMIPAGFMAARGELFPPGSPLAAVSLAIFCGVLGSLLGAYVNYWLALRLGRPFLYKYGKWFFLKPEALERAEAVFREYGDVATFVCRLLPAIRQLISIPAGLARMHFGRFSFFTGLGAGIWVVILTLIGYHFGRVTQEMSYADLVHQGKAIIHHNLLWIVLGCAAIVVGYVYVHKKVMHGKQPAAEKPGGGATK